jgi:Cu/Ag efflux protein CusF
MLVEVHGSFLARAARRAASDFMRWVALVLLVAVAGPSSARASPSSSSSKVKHYTLRAEVVRLPDRPGGYLTLRHEAVDDFTDETGAVVGMDSMVMPFPVGREASLHGLEVGDKIEATFLIDWNEGYMELERITKLPREAVLHFGKARRTGNRTAQSDVGDPEKKP